MNKLSPQRMHPILIGCGEAGASVSIITNMEVGLVTRSEVFCGLDQIDHV